MLERHLRPLVQSWFLDPLAKRLPLSPNLITLLGAFFALWIPVALFQNRPLIALFLLAFSGYIDALDGSVARLHQKSSPFGTVLDICLDRFVECCILIGLFFMSPSHPLLALLMFTSILLCVTSFLVVGLFTANQSEKSFHYSPGLIERPEAFCFFGMMILFPSWYPVIASLFIALVLLTAITRIIQFYNCNKTN